MNAGTIVGWLGIGAMIVIFVVVIGALLFIVVQHLKRIYAPKKETHDEQKGKTPEQEKLDSGK